ncbi:AbrB family transcriptional regulator (plasmid) [Rhizobium sp. YTUHZ045]|uniref:AbrB family transcriptional regulator n=1 Tax=Rhizobium TaxID=379 RepID=UPI0039F67C7B
MSKYGASVAKFALTLSLRALSGWVIWHFGMPLAWFAGAIIATGVAALFKLPVAMPPLARLPMTAAIGVMLGGSFSPAVFKHADSL